MGPLSSVSVSRIVSMVVMESESVSVLRDDGFLHDEIF
jgi:hypothetical protein